MIETDKKAHLSIVPYMELSFDEICELDEDVARQGVWNLREEVKRLQGILGDYRRLHMWIGQKNYELIAEWDEMESDEE